MMSSTQFPSPWCPLRPNSECTGAAAWGHRYAWLYFRSVMGWWRSTGSERLCSPAVGLLLAGSVGSSGAAARLPDIMSIGPWGLRGPVLCKKKYRKGSSRAASTDLHPLPRAHRSSTTLGHPPLAPRNTMCAPSLAVPAGPFLPCTLWT